FRGTQLTEAGFAFGMIAQSGSRILAPLVSRVPARIAPPPAECVYEFALRAEFINVRASGTKCVVKVGG
ncbi:hypothetical protein AB0M86_29645, partial [Streptomyces sp. NPDC051639]